MQTSRLRRLISLVAVAGFVLAACGDDDSGEGGASGDTTTASSGNACDDVTEAMVESALSGFTSIADWQCAVDGDDRPWVGGSGVAEDGGDDEDFVLEAGGDVAFVEYSGSREDAPVPESLLTYCQS